MASGISATEWTTRQGPVLGSKTSSRLGDDCYHAVHHGDTANITAIRPEIDREGKAKTGRVRDVEDVRGVVLRARNVQPVQVGRVVGYDLRGAFVEHARLVRSDQLKLDAHGRSSPVPVR